MTSNSKIVEINQLFTPIKDYINLETGGLIKDKQNIDLKVFDSYFRILNDRYPGFHSNTLIALENKKSAEYHSFAAKLEIKILEKLSIQFGRTTNFDGPSVCGRDCGIYAAITTSCITGCLYSETWCINNGGSGCDAMRQACIENCCSNFCNV